MIAAEVEVTRSRSGWPVRRTLRALGVSPATYYRQQRAVGRPRDPRPVALDAVLPEERAAVLQYAGEHPELRHRALAWSMVDAGAAYVSPSSVYRILGEADMIDRWVPRTRRRGSPLPRPSAPNEAWQTDLRYVKVGGRTYYLLVFLDVHSRFVVYHELLRWMDGRTVSLAAQQALETVPKAQRGRIRIQSDNGSAFVSGEFARTLAVHGVTHHRIYPRTPQQNGFVERVMRTLGEPLHEEELDSFDEAESATSEIIAWYNEQRLHSSLGYLKPRDVHEGRGEAIQAGRREKLAAARQRRRDANLQRRQTRLALTTATPVRQTSIDHKRLSHFG